MPASSWIRNLFAHRKPHFKPKSSKHATAGWYNELKVVWPDGTWTLAYGSCTPAEMDQPVRDHLLLVWAREEFGAMTVAGGALSPNMMGVYVSPIPAGWKPSEKVLRAYWAEIKYELRTLQHVITQLKILGNLNP
jgi:hypothetical protein